MFISKGNFPPLNKSLKGCREKQMLVVPQCCLRHSLSLRPFYALGSNRRQQAWKCPSAGICMKVSAPENMRGLFMHEPGWVGCLLHIRWAAYQGLVLPRLPQAPARIKLGSADNPSGRELCIWCNVRDCKTLYRIHKANLMKDVNTKDTIFEPDFFPFACSPFYTSSIIYQPLLYLCSIWALVPWSNWWRYKSNLTSWE